MNVEIVELNDSGMPGESCRLTLASVPRIGELIAFGDRYFDVVNVINHLDPTGKQSVTVFTVSTKAPYQERKSRFGFGSRS